MTGDEIMAYPDDQGLYILDTDASDSGIGATLSQIQWCEKSQKDEERPIVYASKTLTKTQRRYCVTRKELLAIVTFVQQFRHYLLGRPFVIRTDHSALRVMSFKEPTDQMARWLEILSQFDFKIEHRPGRKHGDADALSRIPCPPDECSCYNGETILKSLPCGGCDQCVKKQWSVFIQESDDVVPLSAKQVERDPVSEDGGGVAPGSRSQASSEPSPSDGKMVTRVRRIRPSVSHLKCRVDSLLVTVALFFTVVCAEMNELVRSIVTMLIGCFAAFSRSIGRMWKSGSNGITAIMRLRKKREDCVLQAAPHGPGPPYLNGLKAGNHSSSLGGGSFKDPLQGKEPSACASSEDPGKPDLTGQEVHPLSQWAGALSASELAELQAKDPDLCVVRDWMLKSTERPERDVAAKESSAVRNLWLCWEQLAMKDGVLYKKWESPKKNLCSMKLVVPKSLHGTILEAAHDSKMAGHLGVNKTLSKIKTSFHWYKMRESVRLWVRNCVKCGARKCPAMMPDYDTRVSMNN